MARVTSEQLGEWFDRHAAGLVLYARQWVGRATAEDVVQEVFVRLGGQEKVPGNVRAWLLVSVRRAALDALKMAGRRRERERRAGEERARLFAETGGERAGGMAGGSEAGDAGLGTGEGGVEEALKKLPGVEREIVTLRIWSGATFEEIGAVMGMAVSSVHTKYRSGLEMLRAGWEARCGKI